MGRTREELRQSIGVWTTQLVESEKKLHGYLTELKDTQNLVLELQAADLLEVVKAVAPSLLQLAAPTTPSAAPPQAPAPPTPPAPAPAPAPKPTLAQSVKPRVAAFPSTTGWTPPQPPEYIGKTFDEETQKAEKKEAEKLEREYFHPYAGWTLTDFALNALRGSAQPRNLMEIALHILPIYAPFRTYRAQLTREKAKESSSNKKIFSTDILAYEGKGKKNSLLSGLSSALSKLCDEPENEPKNIICFCGHPKEGDLRPQVVYGICSQHSTDGLNLRAKSAKTYAIYEKQEAARKRAALEAEKNNANRPAETAKEVGERSVNLSGSVLPFVKKPEEKPHTGTMQN